MTPSNSDLMFVYVGLYGRLLRISTASISDHMSVLARELKQDACPRLRRKRNGQDTRCGDGDMELLIDAIQSFLRSWGAAHRADKRMVRVLSIYDVANAQFLARRLLLEKMGLWKY